jgi:hypothetical protein
MPIQVRITEHVALCCVGVSVMCCAVLCCAVLCCAVLCCADVRCVSLVPGSDGEEEADDERAVFQRKSNKQTPSKKQSQKRKVVKF